MIYALLAALYQKLRHIDQDWMVISLLFLLGLASSVFGYFRSRPKQMHQDLLPSLDFAAKMQQVTQGQGFAKIADSVDSDTKLFTPLQIDAFRLARDLRSFMYELGPKPKREEITGLTVTQQVKQMSEMHAIEHPRENKLINGYSLRFKSRVVEIKHRFGEIGFSDPHLDAVVDQGVVEESNLSDLCKALDIIAVETDANSYVMESEK